MIVEKAIAFARRAVTAPNMPVIVRVSVAGIADEELGSRGHGCRHSGALVAQLCVASVLSERLPRGVTAPGGGAGLPRGADGTYARACSARLGDDAEEFDAGVEA